MHFNEYIWDISLHDCYIAMESKNYDGFSHIAGMVKVWQYTVCDPATVSCCGFALVASLTPNQSQILCCLKTIAWRIWSEIWVTELFKYLPILIDLNIVAMIFPHVSLANIMFLGHILFSVSFVVLGEHIFRVHDHWPCCIRPESSIEI